MKSSIRTIVRRCKLQVLQPSLLQPSNLHVLMTGLLRPSVEYVIWFCNDIRERLPGCKVYILTWETTDEIRKRLEEVFDKVFTIPEPDDTELFKFITARTKDQILNSPFHELVTPRIYKIFYAVRCLIDKLDLLDSDIVMRIRTDNYIVQMGTLQMPVEDQFLYCPKASCGYACDWFGISTLGTLKKLYYISDSQYNDTVANAYNSENIIVKNSKKYGVIMVSINSTTRLAIAREYSPLKLHYYD